MVEIAEKLSVGLSDDEGRRKMAGLEILDMLKEAEAQAKPAIPEETAVRAKSGTPEEAKQGYLKKWEEANRRCSSTEFLCPHCGETVYYCHGANEKLEKQSGGLIRKMCPYRYCPWCGEKVEPVRRF